MCFRQAGIGTYTSSVVKTPVLESISKGILDDSDIDRSRCLCLVSSSRRRGDVCRPLSI